MVNIVNPNISKFQANANKHATGTPQSIHTCVNTNQIKGGYDSVNISDEAKKLARGAVPSGEEMSTTLERFFDTIIAQGGVIGSGGAIINIGTEDDPIIAVVRRTAIIINDEIIDPSTGTPGIPQSTVKMLEYIQQFILSSWQSSQEANGEHNLSLNSESLKDQIQQLVSSFSAVQEEGNSNQHLIFMEDAFRTMSQIMFVNSARVQYARTPNMEFMMMEARKQSNIFVDAFFNSFREHGVNEAFNMACQAIS